jgi:hypothetical protein
VGINAEAARFIQLFEVGKVKELPMDDVVVK